MLLNTNYSFFNLKNINIDDLLIFLVFYVTLESCLEKKTTNLNIPTWAFGNHDGIYYFTFYYFLTFD